MLVPNSCNRKWILGSFNCFSEALLYQSLQLKSTIKGWEEKHKELSEQIKVYQKSLKELEDSVVLKDHNVEVSFSFHSVTTSV